MEMEEALHRNDLVRVVDGYQDGRLVKINEVMEFEHVVRSFGDGRMTDDVPGIYAPDVYDNNIVRAGNGWDYQGNDGWDLMTGYTGQDSYNGPVMHSSEFIGGRMAWDIKENAGIYVAVVVQSLDPLEGCEFCEESGDGGPCDLHNIVGWAVAKRLL